MRRTERKDERQKGEEEGGGMKEAERITARRGGTETCVM
jgi:hypothetical protein